MGIAFVTVFGFALLYEARRVFLICPKLYGLRRVGAVASAATASLIGLVLIVSAIRAAL